jgi:2-polyprenyl-6-methoxyphenol hydroxylase-like FAD-dependent oxidoreductase
MEEVYGYPYFLIHRGDLHKVLLDRAYAVGTVVKVNSFVSEVNEAAPSVTLNDGTVYRADLLIAADGTLSLHSHFHGFITLELITSARNQVSGPKGCDHGSRRGDHP